MHEEIGVAADGRGEVEVVLGAQAVVAGVLRRVHGLHHRAQRQLVERALLGVSLELLEDLVERLRGEVARGHGHAVGPEQREEHVEAILVGVAVVPVDGRQPLLAEEAGDRLVGGQHALLDEAVAVPALAAHQAHRQPVFTQFHLLLGEIELDGAARHAHRGQRRGERHQALEVLLELGATGHLRASEHVVHLGIGTAGHAAHHAGVDLRLQRQAGAIDHHVGDHAQAVDVGLERAGTVGQPLREHRQHAAGQVHGGRATQRLGVQGRAILHVVRDVGDGHHQAPAPGVLLAEDRVVEVTCVFTVDGDQPQRAQVAPLLAAGLGLAHLEGDLVGLVHHLGGELVAKALREGDGQHLDRLVGVGAERTGHFAGQLGGAGEHRVADAQAHLHGVSGAGDLRLGHADVAQFLLARLDPGLLRVLAIDADHLLARARGDLDDAAHGAAVAPGQHLDQHLVVVEGLAGLVGGNEEIFRDLADDGLHEGKAIAVVMDDAHHGVGRGAGARGGLLGRLFHGRHRLALLEGALGRGGRLRLHGDLGAHGRGLLAAPGGP